MRLNELFSSSKWARAFVVLAFFSLLAGPVCAEPVQDEPIHRDTFEPSDWTKEPTYLGKISHKLGFGFLNITAGWTALFFEPNRDQNFFLGVAKGIGYTVTNTAGGILHAATFPIPVDIPLPNGGIAYEY